MQSIIKIQNNMQIQNKVELKIKQFEYKVKIKVEQNKNQVRIKS